MRLLLKTDAASRLLAKHGDASLRRASGLGPVVLGFFVRVANER